MKPTPKTLLTLILVVGIAGIVFGFVQLNGSINEPFNDLDESSFDQASVRDELAVLQEQDTDKDNLSDFDELYLYETSPYIADSDSDGINDNIELSLGQDPNCPEGTVCRSIPLENPNSLEDLLLDNANINASPSDLNVNQNSNQTTTNPSPEEVSIADLRITLEGAGVPKETLDALDDDALLQLYTEALAEETANSNAGTNTTVHNQNANTNVTNVINENSTTADLANLSIDEIRALLIATGVPAESINLLDDATLQAIFDQSLNELSQ